MIQRFSSWSSWRTGRSSSWRQLCRPSRRTTWSRPRTFSAPPKALIQWSRPRAAGSLWTSARWAEPLTEETSSCIFVFIVFIRNKTWKCFHKVKRSIRWVTAVPLELNLLPLCFQGAVASWWWRGRLHPGPSQRPAALPESWGGLLATRQDAERSARGTTSRINSMHISELMSNIFRGNVNLCRMSPLPPLWF